MWILYSVISMLFVSGVDITRKQATKKGHLTSMLALKALFVLLLITPFAVSTAFSLDFTSILIIGACAFFYFLSWQFMAVGIKHLDISVATPLSVISIVVTTLLSVIFLKEYLSVWQIVGIVIVVFGLYLFQLYNAKSKKKNEENNSSQNTTESTLETNSKNEIKADAKAENSEQKITQPENKTKKEKSSTFYIIMYAIGSLCNAGGLFISKIEIKNVSSVDFQFWLYLILAIFYIIVLSFQSIKTKTFIIKKVDLTNWFTYGFAVCAMVADFTRLKALEYPDGSLTVVNLILKLAIVVSAMAGGLLLKEKNLLKKLAFMLLIFGGVAIVILL